MSKLYAQLDENGICTSVTTHETEIEAVMSNLGQRYVDGEWVDVEKSGEPYQPTNAEVAQMISDLQADLIIAGVIG